MISNDSVRIRTIVSDLNDRVRFWTIRSDFGRCGPSFALCLILGNRVRFLKVVP